MPRRVRYTAPGLAGAMSNRHFTSPMGTLRHYFLFHRQSCICKNFQLQNNFWNIVLYVFQYVFVVSLGHVFYKYHSKEKLVWKIIWADLGNLLLVTRRELRRYWMVNQLEINYFFQGAKRKCVQKRLHGVFDGLKGPPMHLCCLNADLKKKMVTSSGFT